MRDTKLKVIVSVLMLTMMLFIGLTTNPVEATSTPPGPQGAEGSWEYVPNVSDEFNGGTLDTSKWKSDNTSWTDFWNWDQQNVAILDNKLKITMSYEPHSTLNQSPYGWSVKSWRWGFPWSYSTNTSPRTGTMHLRHQAQEAYGIQDALTYQEITVPNGTYTFKAYAKSSGGQSQAFFRIKKHGGSDIQMNINQSSSYTAYDRTINVTSGRVLIEVMSEFTGDQFVDVDDITLIKSGETTNRVTNGSFDENVRSVAYNSGSIVSRNRVPAEGTYFYEARIKGAPKFPGVCPAFWATHYSDKEHREIDFVELTQAGRTTMEYVLHSAYSEEMNKVGDTTSKWTSGIGHQQYQKLVDGVAVDPADDFHVYGAKVLGSKIELYFDSVKVRTMTASGNWVFGNKDYNIWLSMGVRDPLRGNPSSVGFPTSMEVDYVRVYKDVTATQPLIEVSGPNVDDANTNIRYTGAWNHPDNNSLWANDTISASNSLNASAEMLFSGNSIKLLGRKSSWSGKMDVYIDDVFQQTIDTYSAALQDQVLIYENTSLSNGQHTIRVVCKGEKNSASSGMYIHVDKFEINQPVITQAVTVDDSDSSMVYVGDWNTVQRADWYNNTIHSTNTLNASAQYTFTGTSVKLFGRKANWCGKMDIYIDDTKVQTVDTYSSSVQDQVLLYENTSLSNGQHIIKVVCINEKRAESKNSYIHVDKLEYQ